MTRSHISRFRMLVALVAPMLALASIGCSGDEPTDVSSIQSEAKNAIPKDIKPLDPAKVNTDLKSMGKRSSSGPANAPAGAPAGAAPNKEEPDVQSGIGQ